MNEVCRKGILRPFMEQVRGEYAPWHLLHFFAEKRLDNMTDIVYYSTSALIHKAVTL